MARIANIVGIAGSIIGLYLLSFTFVTVENFQDSIFLGESSKALFICVSLSFLILEIFSAIPSFMVVFTNGLVLGPYTGILISVLGLSMGSSIGYIIGRYTTTLQIFKNKMASFNRLEKLGPLAIIISRNIPGISELLSFYFGYARMSYPLFLLSNFLGYFPICLVYVYCGSWSQNPEFTVLSIGFSILLAFAFFLLQKRIFKHYSIKSNHN